MDSYAKEDKAISPIGAATAADPTLRARLSAPSGEDPPVCGGDNKLDPPESNPSQGSIDIKSGLVKDHPDKGQADTDKVKKEFKEFVARVLENPRSKNIFDTGRKIDLPTTAKAFYKSVDKWPDEEERDMRRLLITLTLESTELSTQEKVLHMYAVAFAERRTS